MRSHVHGQPYCVLLREMLRREEITCDCARNSETVMTKYGDDDIDDDDDFDSR